MHCAERGNDLGGEGWEGEGGGEEGGHFLFLMTVFQRSIRSGNDWLHVLEAARSFQTNKQTNQGPGPPVNTTTQARGKGMVVH